MHLLKTELALFACFAFGATQIASAADDISAAARTLAEAAKTLPAAERDAVEARSLAIVLLAEKGRLLPATMKGPALEPLRPFLFSPGDDNASRLADRLPPADKLIFDGSRLAGGNFEAIDHVVGTDGRPIAMDRVLPVRIVPIDPGSAAALAAAGTAYRSTAEAATIAARTDRFFMSRVSPNLVADGLLLRPYAGKMDDLYYHLVQEGTIASLFDFYAIVDSLPARSYHPVGGVGAYDSVPPIWFSLSDVLAGGGLAAVQTFRARHSQAIARNPFAGFAGRVLPFVPEGERHLPAGTELRIERTKMRQAMRDRRRFTPAAVPPLFRDPSRFYGGMPSEIIRVKNRGGSQTELKKQSAKIAREESLPELTEPAGNAVLDDDLPKNPEPVDEILLIPRAEPVRRALPVDQTSEAMDSQPIDETDAPVEDAATPPDQSAPLPPKPIAPPPSSHGLPPTPNSPFQVAILAPTVADAEEYVLSIAASEARLVENARESKRVACYLYWLQETVAAFRVSPQTETSAEAIRLATSQMIALLEKKETLANDRMKELTARGALRRALEEQLRGDRMQQLSRLLGTSA